MKTRRGSRGKRIGDQVIVITGASSGIGLATAREAARRGAKVVLAARNEHDLSHAIDGIVRDGGDAIAVPTDVSDYTQVAELARRAARHYGRIDTWVNNAGVSAYARFREQPLEDMRRVLEVNFIGQVHGAHAALPYLEQTAGALICVGSALSDRGVPLQGIYCASKHALKGWLDALRVELREEGSPVRVTLVKPSSIDTPLFNKAKTQLGVMPRPISPIYRPELAAEAILGAAEGNEREVFVGGGGKLLSLAERISPRAVDLLERYQGFSSQRTDWPKDPASPHNLYSPLEDDGGIYGDFPNAHRRSSFQSVDAREGAASLGIAASLAIAARSTANSRRARVALLAAGAAFLGKAALSRIVG